MAIVHIYLRSNAQVSLSRHAPMATTPSCPGSGGPVGLYKTRERRVASGRKPALDHTGHSRMSGIGRIIFIQDILKTVVPDR
jgi:hypothetical protein